MDLKDSLSFTPPSIDTTCSRRIYRPHHQSAFRVSIIVMIKNMILILIMIMIMIMIIILMCSILPRESTDAFIFPSHLFTQQSPHLASLPVAPPCSNTTIIHEITPTERQLPPLQNSRITIPDKFIPQANRTIAAGRIDYEVPNDDLH